MNQHKKITGGLYLVVDPGMGQEYVLPRLQKAIEGGIEMIQIWDHWKSVPDKERFLSRICHLAGRNKIPVLINNDWQLLKNFPINGIHFDKPVADLQEIRNELNKPFYMGVTCGNDLQTVKWANENQLDYISFCSMFPSASAGACELVDVETVKQARELTSIPIFLSGGITLENVNLIKNTGMNGIALISSIMKAENPRKTAQVFKEHLKELSHHEK